MSKRPIFFWCSLALAGLLFGGGNIAHAEGTPTNGPAKLELMGDWTNVMVKLVVPGSSNPPVKCTIEEVPAKRADYKVVPTPPLPYWKQFSILAIHDPHAKLNCVIFATHLYFVSGKSGMTGFNIYTPGIYWSRSFVALPDAEGDLNAAIAKFGKEFDGWKVNEALAQERHDRLGFQRVTPLFFFQVEPVGGAKNADMNVEGFEVTDGIARLDVKNGTTHQVASFWIDWPGRKFVKSMVNGREIDLDNTAQPWGEFKPN